VPIFVVLSNLENPFMFGQRGKYKNVPTPRNILTVF
jgi:hypothetical protein